METDHRNFVPGSRVLAYHGPLVYEAKVLKYHEVGLAVVDVEEDKSEPLAKNKIPAFLLDKNAYFLHYKGWNPKWDEWVSSERIIEFNNDNLGLSRELRNARKKTVERLDLGKEAKAEAAEQKIRRGKKKDSSEALKRSLDASRELSRSNGTSRKRHKTETRSGYEIMLPFSPKLKCIMVDDWEIVTKDRKVIDPETTTPVADILQKYLEWKSARQSDELSRTTNEAVSGLKVLFDETFGVDLLYKFERLQYSELLRTRKSACASAIYGVEHLLRLLISLPGRVAQTTMDAVSVNIMMSQMSQLLDYIDENMATLGSSYMNVSSQYDRVARV